MRLDVARAFGLNHSGPSLRAFMCFGEEIPPIVLVIPSIGRRRPCRAVRRGTASTSDGVRFDGDARADEDGQLALAAGAELRSVVAADDRHRKAPYCGRGGSCHPTVGEPMYRNEPNRRRLPDKNPRRDSNAAANAIHCSAFKCTALALVTSGR
ncbi:unnamed protein product [Soboliphyme baturini]|uniref:Transposase n=1 Tax=Soboliphyme baturini TaxID=241478 RepID=A0A183IUW9_9BILA|nr:unnamed protein product [Soboliphyme baturini]